MSDSLDDQLKEIQIEKTRAEINQINEQIKKTQEETKKIYTETKTSWLEITKVISSAVFAVIGWLIAWQTQSTRVEIANQEKVVAEKAVITTQNEAKNSILPMKQELTKVTAELKQSKPDVISNPLVYLQFQGDITREFMNELRKSLQNDGFNVPGAQRISGNYKSEIKYFANEDKETAERLAEAVKNFFESKKCPVLNLPVTLNTATKGKSSPPEVWLAEKDDCDDKK